MPKSVVVTINDHGHIYKALGFCCPGCKAGGREGYEGYHQLPIYREGETPPVETAWKWNGDLEFPTLEPSILSHQGQWVPRCHSFLRNGVFEFLSDCTHPLANQHVPIPDLPDWVTREGEADG